MSGINGSLGSNLTLRFHGICSSAKPSFLIRKERCIASHEVNGMTPEENQMNIDMNMAKQAILDKLEAQIKTAEAKLATLKARAETMKANVEIKAITELLTRKQMIEQKLQELKKSGGVRWEQAKADLEARIADLEKSVKGIESKAKAS